MSGYDMHTEDFTDRAWEQLYEVAEDPYFRSKDAQLIYEALRDHLEPIPFCDHLKRYIFRKAELEGSWDKIPLQDYQAIIREAFQDNMTPPSFFPTTEKLSAMCRNWLTQQTVKRQVILLLGFGLRMSAADVDLFLTKVLGERGLDENDPFELLCSCCYEQGGYPRFEELYAAYRADQIPEGCEQIFVRLKTCRERENAAEQKTYEVFRRLYAEVQQLIAAMYERTERWSLGKPSEITASDLEHVLCAAIPVDKHGNLAPNSRSTLAKQFAGKRFSRQRLSELMTRRTPVSRYDLITLNFFIYSQKESLSSEKGWYIRYIDSTNALLKECGFGELYAANPYECFIMMCILTDNPMSTYGDVWELSYTEEKKE